MKDIDLDFLYFMKGAMDMNDDLSDGAWWSYGEEMVELYNKAYKQNYDPYEGFQHYIEMKGDL